MRSRLLAKLAAVASFFGLGATHRDGGLVSEPAATHSPAANPLPEGDPSWPTSQKVQPSPQKMSARQARKQAKLRRRNSKK